MFLPPFSHSGRGLEVGTDSNLLSETFINRTYAKNQVLTVNHCF
ncbi:MAG: hypothetical protein O4805_13390 [Trichodesmium sp. St16_bin2-tuft]|jgi:hypothetical protein|nr:hypothetical protein [Trichodesmium sp. St16_bin2-tuft]